MLIHHHYHTSDYPCSYLPEQVARLEEKVVEDLGAEEWEFLLSQGWRRFGSNLFRPACLACQQCVSIRLSPNKFIPSDSQKRAERRCAKFKLTLQKPLVDEEHLTLYHAWHTAREEIREWNTATLTDEDYFYQFAVPCESAWEFSWRDPVSGELLAVSLVDLTPKALSLIYFFYSPKIARLSPGVANVTKAVTFAKETSRNFIYLGFRILGCASSVYKADYKPHELLFERPAEKAVPDWKAGTQG